MGQKLSRKRRVPRSGGAPGQPCGGAAAGTSAPEPQQQGLGRLHRAAARGHLAWLRRWRWWMEIWGIDRRDRENRTPLHLACANGHTEVARFLVKHGSQLDAVDNFGRTPLMKAVQLREQDCVTFLLEQGADPNLADIDGNTALQLAILARSKNLVGQLIKHGAKLDAKNKKGSTPLTLAITEEHKEILEDLLKAGADVHARDEHERTPLMIAASVGEMYLVKVLLSHGAKFSHEDKDGRIAVDYADLHGHLRVSQYLAKLEDTAEAPAGDALGSPEQAGAAGGIKEKPDQENTEEAPVCDAEDNSIVITPEQAGAAPMFWGAPAVDRGATDDLCEGGSVRSSETEMNDNTWKDSEGSLLFTPKHLLQGDSAVMGNLIVADEDSSPWDSEEESPVEEVKQEKGGKSEEKKAPAAWIVKHHVCNGDSKVPKAASRDITGEHSGCTSQISAAAEKEVIKDAIENSVVQEQLAQVQRENLLLRQQLEDRKRQLIQENVLTVAQDCFNDIFKNLKADTEQKVYLLEEKNKELYESCSFLRKQVLRCEVDKVEAQCKIRGLQQELADALKKLSMVEASLDVATHYRRNLEEATLGLKKELRGNKSKLQELEEHLQHEHSIRDLKSALENKEREKRDCFQRLEDLLLASSGSTIAMKHLEERIQCLEAKNARLQATVVQQNSRIETLLQGSPLEQAASQDREEEIRAHDHEAERKLLLRRVGDLKQELESEKYTLRESIVLKEKYEKLYLEEVKKRRWLQNKLERAEENQGKAKRKLCGKLVLSSSISEDLDVSAEQYLVEHSGITLSLSSSLGESFPLTGSESLGNNICTHYAAQSESDRKKEKEELSCPLQVHLDRELEINMEVEEESESSESFSSIKEIIREYGERMSLHELKKQIKDGSSEMANEAAKMHTKLDKLSCQLKEEPKAGMMAGETQKKTSKWR